MNSVPVTSVVALVEMLLETAAAMTMLKSKSGIYSAGFSAKRSKYICGIVGDE